MHVPGRTDATVRVLEWIAENAAAGALLSLMFQYTPMAGDDPRAPGRRTSRREHAAVTGALFDLDIEEGFVQDLSANREWLPDFALRDPFSSDLSRRVWSWKG